MADASIPPTKRQRILGDESHPSPPPPPPPDAGDIAPVAAPNPGPPGSPPPPPPPEPPATLDQALNSDIVPPPPSSNPPPPPPPPEQVVDDDDNDAEVQDAEYWTRLAQSSSSSSSTASHPPSKRIPSISDPGAPSSSNFLTKKGKQSALYLDTINRGVLDFDFEKLCSVSLSNINVYACLVCGRYFQGRGRNSYAYLHSIDDSHHVFMNLTTAQTYVLPDNYAVPEENQAALQDIKYLLNPTFARKTIEALDGMKAHDLNGERYYPGFIGLNNVGKNDYVNAVVQALVHVPEVRDYFLEGKETEATDGKEKSELVKRFGALVRKMWNPKAFKPQVSPHEFLQQVAQVSGNRFKITHQSDPVEFLGWLLNRLHADLSSSLVKGGKRKRGGAGGGESIISKCFQGVVQVESQPLVRAEESDPTADSVAAKADAMMNNSNGTNTAPSNGQIDEEGKIRFDPTTLIEKRDSPFFLLAMDLPTPPPVLSEDGETLVPQVTISQILSKYDGQSLHESIPPGKLTRYNLRRLPPYLIIHFRRFTKNSLGQEERNPTLVNFPIKGLDITRHAPLLRDDKQQSLPDVYDLVANVVYDAVPGTVRQGASWKCQVHTNTTKQANNQHEAEKWFDIQDLLVEEVNRQMIFLGESYLQIWARRTVE